MGYERGNRITPQGSLLISFITIFPVNFLKGSLRKTAYVFVCKTSSSRYIDHRCH